MKPVIIYDAIKRARISIEGKIDALPSGVSEIKSGVTDFKSSFNSWKSDWTSSRASKLDKLDKFDETISSRASESSVAGVQGTLRELVPVIRSRASQESIANAIIEIKKEPNYQWIRKDFGLEKSIRTLLEINGSGLFDGVVYMPKSDHDRSLKIDIIVDGKHLVRGTYNSEKTSDPRGLLVTCINGLYFGFTGTSGSYHLYTFPRLGYFKLEALGGKKSISPSLSSDFIQKLDTGNIDSIFQANPSCVATYFFEKPIKFKKSLVVKAAEVKEGQAESRIDSAENYEGCFRVSYFLEV